MKDRISVFLVVAMVVLLSGCSGLFDSGGGGGGNNAVSVTGVSIDPANATIEVGEQLQLNATVEPSDANDTSVSWSSGNESVVTVDTEGVVTGVTVGDAVVAVLTGEGGFTAETAITVTAAAAGGGTDDGAGGDDGSGDDGSDDGAGDNGGTAPTVLQSIAINGEPLPDFSPTVYSYTLRLSVGSTSINIAAEPSDTTASIDGAGTGLSLTTGKNAFEIIVTAATGESSATYTVTVEVPPVAPTGLSATEGDSSGVVLAWDDVAGVENYEVFRRPVDGTFASTPIGIADVSTYTDSSSEGLSGDIYEYRVVALADGIAGAASGTETGYAGGDASVSVTFAEPGDPALIAGAPTGPITQETPLTVNLEGSYLAATWYLNGVADAPAFSHADTRGATFNPAGLSGPQTVSVVVSDGTKLFSAQFTVTVETTNE